MNSDLLPVLQQLRAGLEAQYGDRLDRVLLYGSQARGDATSESDVDVLVVLRGAVDALTEIHRNSELVADLSLAYDLLISCVYMSAEELLEGDDPFLRNVQREALPL